MTEGVAGSAAEDAEVAWRWAAALFPGGLVGVRAAELRRQYAAEKAGGSTGCGGDEYSALRWDRTIGGGVGGRAGDVPRGRPFGPSYL